MDQADMADKIIADYMDSVIAAARGIRTDTGLSAESGENCRECGEEIPAARRQAIAGCRYCVECTASMEYKQKGHARPMSGTRICYSLEDTPGELEF